MKSLRSNASVFRTSNSTEEQRRRSSKNKKLPRKMMTMTMLMKSNLKTKRRTRTVSSVTDTFLKRKTTIPVTKTQKERSALGLSALNV